jgi:NAD(P)-dependent dehydrogenase (short-subunit alcohol dehydrogenase family)
LAEAGRLAGKNAVITGAAGNIGKAVARRFLDEGADVLLVDRDPVALKRATGDLHDSRATAFVADVTQSESVQSYARLAGEVFGKVDVFFNNAGIEGPSAPIGEFPEDAFDRVMAVNVRGVFLGMKYVPPVMRDGGSVIVTSSIAGLKASGGFVAYTASKHAVIGIMRDTAVDLAPRRIRVNSIHPGFVESDMMRRILLERSPGGDADQLVKDFTRHTRLGRFVRTDEIAALVTVLACEESAMCTGQTFTMDAGTLL